MLKHPCADCIVEVAEDLERGTARVTFLCFNDCKKLRRCTEAVQGTQKHNAVAVIHDYVEHFCGVRK